MSIPPEQQKDEPLSLANLPPSSSNLLTRSDSTSTMILCLEESGPTRPRTTWRSSSAAFRSLLRTSGLFNADLESAEKFSELFANSQFGLHRLLSNVDNAALDDIMDFDAKTFDSSSIFNARSLSELFQTEYFDQVDGAATSNTQSELPPATSFCELRSVSPELITDELFQTSYEQMKMEPAAHGQNNPLIYTQLDSMSNLLLEPLSAAPTTAPALPTRQQATTTMSAPPIPQAQHFTFDQNPALAAFEHDHAFLSKKSTPSRKRTRASARTQSTTSSIGSAPAATSINNNDDSSSCAASPSTAALLTPPSEGGSASSRTKRSRLINRAKDIQTAEDLDYYLERRRKNNEASKMSRAARKQKFGTMDGKCSEYERVNEELRVKIATLETVTATLKCSLVTCFKTKKQPST